jgi:3-dehydroquinate synthase
MKQKASIKNFYKGASLPSSQIDFDQLRDVLCGCFVISDDNIASLYPDILQENCFVIPHGEQSKSFDCVQKIIAKMLECNVGRKGCIAAVGGGVVGDISGFVASIFMRGIDWICVPTSLLAIVDSSIGGKTGVDFCGIKNLVGSFYPPKHTYVCYDFLKTLPQNERQNGWAEIVKTALLDKKLFDLVAKSASEREIIDRCLQVKTAIVEQDFWDNGGRQSLNLGHTIGHAIEMLCSLSHGESVLVGLVLEGYITGTKGEVWNYILRHCQSKLRRIEWKRWDSKKIADAALHDKKNDDGIAIIKCLEVEKTQKLVFSKEEIIQKLDAFFAENQNLFLEKR